MRNTSCTNLPTRTIFLRGFLAIALIVLTSMSIADESNEIRVLVVGDSISAAWGIATEDGWVAQMQKKADDSNIDMQVVNASISGDTTTNGVSRLPKLLEEHEPDVVIIELGGNDGLRGQSLKHIKANLIKMANWSKDIGADVIIVAVQLPNNYGSAYNRLFGEMFSSAATETDSTLVPSLFDGLDASGKWFQSDGIHPNEDAQLVMLENVWREASTVIERVQSALTE